jgi:hypothetical protein
VGLTTVHTWVLRRRLGRRNGGTAPPRGAFLFAGPAAWALRGACPLLLLAALRDPGPFWRPLAYTCTLTTAHAIWRNRLETALHIVHQDLFECLTQEGIEHTTVPKPHLILPTYLDLLALPRHTPVAVLGLKQKVLLGALVNKRVRVV